MGKKRKPLWLKLILGLISSILSIAVLLAIACGFLYIRYQINVFTVVNQVKTLNQPVNLTSLTPNAFTSTDLAEAKASTDLVLPNFISYDSLTDKYIIPGEVENYLAGDIKLTDKQIGAVLNNFMQDEEITQTPIGNFELVQIQFSEIGEKTADFNVVVKFDLEKIKEKMTSFPLNWISKIVPNELYVSSTVTIQHGENAFEYTTVGKCMRINNLNEKETNEAFRMINIFLKTGSAEEFGKTIGDTFVNILIGNEQNSGLAYSLKNISGYEMATDYTFETIGTDNYFVIKH